MSDAKVKAEARRAKILAREGTRLALAKGDITTLNAEDEQEKTSKDRPLASRRNMIKVETNESKVVNAEDENPADIPDTKETQESVLTPQIVREIEREIAQNTQKFDETQLSSKTEQNEEKKKINKSIHLNQPISSPVQAYQVMQLVRLIGIILIAVWTGYNAVVSGSPSFSTDSGARDRLNDFLSASISTEEIDTSVGPTNGLFGWIGKKIASQTESSVTAVSLVWWISSMLSTAVNRLFPHKPKSSGIMNTILNIYNDGLNVVAEYVIRIVGEISVHFIVTIGTAAVVSAYLESSKQSSSNGKHSEF